MTIPLRFTGIPHRTKAPFILLTEVGEVDYIYPFAHSKPRITRVNGAWVCHKGTRYGWSYSSPILAYQRWLRTELAL